MRERSQSLIYKLKTVTLYYIMLGPESDKSSKCLSFSFSVLKNNLFRSRMLIIALILVEETAHKI
jgi:hypothetical protein